MNKKFSILLALAVLIASTLACAVGGELSLENPRLSKDDTGDSAVTSFSSDDTFYVVADLNNATKGTTVEVKWYVVDVPGYESGPIAVDANALLTITEDSFTGTVNFSLSSTESGGWPAGGYKVELYMNGVLTHTIDFSVQ